MHKEQLTYEYAGASVNFTISESRLAYVERPSQPIFIWYTFMCAHNIVRVCALVCACVNDCVHGCVTTGVVHMYRRTWRF